MQEAERRETPSDPRACGESHGAEQRNDPHEARQVRLHLIPLSAVRACLLSDRQLGGLQTEVPGFASPPRDGFALDDVLSLETTVVSWVEGTIGEAIGL